MPKYDVWETLLLAAGDGGFLEAKDRGSSSEVVYDKGGDGLSVFGFAAGRCGCGESICPAREKLLRPVEGAAEGEARVLV